MQSYKTSGIVLKSTNFGEADKILTVFTERLGKVKVMAKGIKKLRSHLAGSLEPFMLVDLQLHEGKTFYLPTGASIISDFPAIHTDLSKTARAFFLGEITDRFLEEKEKAPEVFELFVSALSEVNDDLPGPLIQAYELKIIGRSGFQPELYECVHCKEKISAGENFWDGEEGGVICENCNSKFHHGRPIADATIKLLRFFESNSFESISKLKVAKDVEVEAESILKALIESILERELKSEKFLKMIK